MTQNAHLGRSAFYAWHDTRKSQLLSSALVASRINKSPEVGLTSVPIESFVGCLRIACINFNSDQTIDDSAGFKECEF